MESMPTSSVGNSRRRGRGLRVGGRGDEAVHHPRASRIVLTRSLTIGLEAPRIVLTQRTGAPLVSVARVGHHSLTPDPRPLTPAPRFQAPDPRSGVTLIEMLVVVAIIGLMIAISFPSVTAGLDSVRMSSATGSVSAFLNSAVNRAERKQQPVALAISVKDNLIAMYGNEPGSERKLKLPDGVSIQAVLPALEGETPDQPRQLILMPGGTAPAIGIVLANEHGTRRIVRLDPMTGYPRVESVPNK
ncbi:MAG: prepilin-type N-terminal cleavage/methylation domain-containing protein [Bryobacteraceae bacterium]